LLLYLVLSSCDLFDPEEEASIVTQGASSSSTVGQSSVGNGKTGSLSEYFYDFSSTINNKFQRFSLRDGSILNESLWSDEDTVNFFSYTDILEITSDNIEDYKELTGLDESNGGACSLGVCSGDPTSLSKEECCVNNGGSYSGAYECTDIDEGVSWVSNTDLDVNGNGLYEESEYTDSCQDLNGDGLLGLAEYEGLSVSDFVVIYSGRYTDINAISWDKELKRYVFSLNDDVVKTDTVFYEDGVAAESFDDVNNNGMWDEGENFDDLDGDSEWDDAQCLVQNCDVFDSLVYKVEIDSYENTVDGFAFLDPNEWIQRDSVIYNSDNVSFVASFSLVHKDLNISYISPIYRKFSDCNDNGVWDQKENTNVIVELIDENPPTDESCENAGYLWWNGESTCTQLGVSKWVGIVDPASGLEETVWYIDEGNGKYDEAEPFYNYDLSTDEDTGFESWNGNEPYLNRNCNDLKINGGPDDAEIRYDSLILCQSSCELDCKDCEVEECSSDELDCIKGSCVEDDIGYFCDLPNGRWDDDEEFHDCGYDNLCVEENEVGDQGEANSTWDCFDSSGNKLNSDGENASSSDFLSAYLCEGLFQVSQVPDNIIIDYADPVNPKAKKNFGLGDPYVEKVGSKYFAYDSLINYITENDVQETLKPNIDTVFTIYSNKVIENGEELEGEYHITKVKSQSTDPANAGLLINEYAYNLFKTSDSDIVKLFHPAYFLPDGYYSAYLDIVGSDNEQGTSDDDFWVEKLPSDETFIYSSNGLIRDGEYIYSIKNDTTDVGIYEVEEIYEVDYVETVNVPSEEVESPPGNFIQPVAYNDVFLIKKTVKMTLIGPGIKYIQQHKMYLAKDVGIIRDEVNFGWGQAANSSSEYSSEDFSRWDLLRSSQTSSEGGGLLRSLMSNSKKVSLDRIEDAVNFDNDPYVKVHTIGIQPIN